MPGSRRMAVSSGLGTLHSRSALISALYPYRSGRPLREIANSRASSWHAVCISGHLFVTPRCCAAWSACRSDQPVQTSLLDELLPVARVGRVEDLGTRGGVGDGLGSLLDGDQLPRATHDLEVAGLDGELAFENEDCFLVRQDPWLARCCVCPLCEARNDVAQPGRSGAAVDPDRTVHLGEGGVVRHVHGGLVTHRLSIPIWKPGDGFLVTETTEGSTWGLAPPTARSTRSAREPVL